MDEVISRIIEAENSSQKSLDDEQQKSRDFVDQKRIELENETARFKSGMIQKNREKLNEAVRIEEEKIKESLTEILGYKERVLEDRDLMKKLEGDIISMVLNTE